MEPPKTEDYRIIRPGVPVRWFASGPHPKKIAGLSVMFPSIEPLVG